MKKILWLCALISLTSLLIADQITIRRERTFMRTGAGSFYPVVSEIPVNSVVTSLGKENSWLKISFNSQTGYISESALQSSKAKNDVFAKLSAQAPSQTSVSKHSISAGVKGFGERFNASFNGDASFMDTVLNDKYNAWFFNDFKRNTYTQTKAEDYRKAHKLPKASDSDFYSEAQEGFGLAVAAAIAKMGLYKNAEAREYISHLGNLIVEASDMPDLHFRFFILDIPQANAYACPGGIVFITRGMLKTVTNEAELAFVLAHEIAHVNRFHGIVELSKRKNQIAAEDLFAELDFETPDSFSESAKETEAELETEIYQMFESLIEGRLDIYEAEADAFALLYIARTGYDPQAASDLLQRMASRNAASNNQHYRPESTKDRASRIQKESTKYHNRKLKYFRQQERFQRYIKYF